MRRDTYSPAFGAPVILPCGDTLLPEPSWADSFLSAHGPFLERFVLFTLQEALAVQARPKDSEGRKEVLGW